MRSEIAFGVAIIAIGYDLLPLKESGWLLWIGGIAIMIAGIWILYPHIRNWLSKYW